MRKRIWFLVLLLFLVLFVWSFRSLVLPKLKLWLIEKQNNETIAEFDDLSGNDKENDIVTPSISGNDHFLDVLPKKSLLDVQFICQAPLQTEENWKLHEESCEEAALLMAYDFKVGRVVSRGDANEIILDMIEWEKENLGGHHDLYADEMKIFAMGYLELSDEEVLILRNATLEDIENEIVQGRPVIVPITGELLKNPYYPYPGYHMLLVTGFTEDMVITNDNGTRRGEDFSYKKDVFMKAFEDAGGDALVLL